MGLDALGDRLMYRLAYRNFGDHESIVANHTVVAGSGATGVRWYEVRNPNGSPAIYQQGTFAPDADNRWMASIAMDHTGNIGVGYSVSSSGTFPSIRYTGWEVGNPLGTLQAETSLVAGGGSQTGYSRWGDYSAMRIDPSDDCTVLVHAGVSGDDGIRQLEHAHRIVPVPVVRPVSDEPRRRRLRRRCPRPRSANP